MSGYRGNPEFSASIVDAFINRKHLKGFIGVVALIVMIVGSLFAWFYFLALGGEKGQKIILMEAVIYGAILVISLVFLFVIGYERSALTFLRISYIAGVVLSVAGFYVLGIGLMALCGGLLYVFAPQMFAFLTPVEEIQQLGIRVLRIELIAEPMFAASIVGAGIFRGAGRTRGSTAINLIGMWVIRLPMAAVVSRRIGLAGVWIAMCVDLCARGLMFLIRLGRSFRE